MLISEIYLRTIYIFSIVINYYTSSIIILLDQFYTYDILIHRIIYLVGELWQNDFFLKKTHEDGSITTSNFFCLNFATISFAVGCGFFNRAPEYIRQLTYIISKLNQTKKRKTLVIFGSLANKCSSSFISLLFLKNMGLFGFLQQLST